MLFINDLTRSGFWAAKLSKFCTIPVEFGCALVDGTVFTTGTVLTGTSFIITVFTGAVFVLVLCFVVLCVVFLENK